MNLDKILNSYNKMINPCILNTKKKNNNLFRDTIKIVRIYANYQNIYFDLRNYQLHKYVVDQFQNY